VTAKDVEISMCRYCGRSHNNDASCPGRVALALISPSVFTIKDLNNAGALLLRDVIDRFLEEHVEIVENWVWQQIEIIERRSHEN